MRERTDYKGRLRIMLEQEEGQQEEEQQTVYYQVQLPASVEQTLYSLQVNPQLFAGLPIQNQLEGLTGSMLVKHHRKRTIIWLFVLLALALATLTILLSVFVSPWFLICAPFWGIGLFAGYHAFMTWFGMKMIQAALHH